MGGFIHIYKYLLPCWCLSVPFKIVCCDETRNIIFITATHLEMMLAEYVDYYNLVRTHQTLNGEPPIRSVPLPKTAVKDTKLYSSPILSGLYHDYKKAT